MIYLSIFVVVVVFLPFGASEDLIRDSQRLIFCKSVSGNAQYDISKWAAV